MLDYASLVNSGEVPRLHPNGFIQLNLNRAGTCRLHIWSPNITPDMVQKTRHPIHDHIFDMESTILLGSMENWVYEFIDSGIRREYALFQGVYKTPHESTLEPLGRVGWLKERYVRPCVGWRGL